jgi:hypothetical protein
MALTHAQNRQVLSLTFSQIISPLKPEDFISTVFGTTTHHFHGDPQRFSSLLSWNDLNDILQFHRLSWPRVRVARDGEIVPEEEYSELVERRVGSPYRQIRLPPLLDVLRAGGTIVIDRVDKLHKSLASMAAEFEAVLQTAVFVNLYASWGKSAGFPDHWDDHDVFVLQIAGAKNWNIYGPTRMWPLDRDYHSAEGPPLESPESVLLSPGDVFYIPQGWWHSAAPCGGPSLHVSIGINPENGIDLATWLVDRLRKYEVFRRRLPRYEIAAKMKMHLGELRSILNTVLDQEGLIDDFLLDRKRIALPREKYSLPYSVSADLVQIEEAEIELLYPMASCKRLNDCVVFVAGAKKWTFASPAAVLLDKLMQERVVELSELRRMANGIVSVKQINDIIRLFLEGGIVSLTPRSET